MNDIIDTSQLTFKCAEIDQPKPILNPSFYTSDTRDRNWIMQLWNWCNSNGPDSEIRYAPFKLLFIDNVEAQLQELGSVIDAGELVTLANSERNSELFKEGDKDSVQKLRRLLMFSTKTTDYLQWMKDIYSHNTDEEEGKIKREDLINKINATLNNAKGKFAVSAPLLPSKTMTEILHIIGRDVQSSGRDAATGREQRREGEKETDSYRRTSRYGNNSRGKMSKDTAEKVIQDTSKKLLSQDLSKTIKELKRQMIRQNRNSREDVQEIIDALTSLLTD